MSEKQNCYSNSSNLSALPTYHDLDLDVRINTYLYYNNNDII